MLVEIFGSARRRPCDTCCCPGVAHARRILALFCLLLCLVHMPAYASRKDQASNGRAPRRMGMAEEVPSTGPAMWQSFILRLAGPSFVPFTLQHQQIVLEAFRQVMLPREGPVALTTYREGFPDPNAVDNATERYPYTDLAGSLYDMLGENTSRANWQPNVQGLLTTFNRVIELGNFTLDKHSLRLLMFIPQYTVLEKPVVPQTIVPIVVILAIQLSNPTGKLEPRGDQANVVLSMVGQALKGTSILVLVREFDQPTVQRILGPDATQKFADRQLLLIEVTLPTCVLGNATADSSLATPQCEQRIASERIQGFFQQDSTQELLGNAGIEDVEVAAVRPRQPALPTNVTGVSPSGFPTKGYGVLPWVPEHLDRIDQRGLPLDGRFAANASATGVNIYLISSGVRADHVEFKYSDGRPGTRVKAAWGLSGLEADKDCDDSFAWYGFGTLAASIIAGLKVGVAKNATIHSVRFRGSCLIDTPASYSPSGLPTAIKFVAQNHVKPAVLMIDTWWRPDRFEFDDDEALTASINEALDACQDADLTVITGAAGGSCLNPIAAHPGTLSVGVLSGQFFRGWGNDSSCIDLWSPGGQFGTGITGANPSGNADYRTAMPVATGGAYVVAGVAAQYLSKNPNATSEDVRRELVENATPNGASGVGYVGTSGLVYTNYTDPPPPPPPPAPPAPPGAASSGSSSPSLTIILPAALGGAALAAAIAGAFVFARRRRRLAQGRLLKVEGNEKSGSAPNALLRLTSKAGPEWEIPAWDIEFCKYPDGSEWVLGEGSFGQVVKAIKGGVQVVAVKKLHGRYVDGSRPKEFEQEIMLMKFVSRDANITQFYGACLSPLMLVVEFLEGGDLRNALSADQTGELGWYKAGKGICLDILRGLHFLHTNRVIHRDLKSKNILLTKQGRAKLADVGLAQLLEEEVESAEGFVGGTFAWAAPELLLGYPTTEKADIYSFGVCLWELVTGEAPIRGSLYDPAVPQQCPQEVAAAIEECLQADPSLRPSARELYTRLQACPPNAETAGSGSLVSESGPSASTPSAALEAAAASSRGGASTTGAPSTCRPLLGSDSASSSRLEAGVLLPSPFAAGAGVGSRMGSGPLGRMGSDALGSAGSGALSFWASGASCWSPQASAAPSGQASEQAGEREGEGRGAAPQQAAHTAAPPPPPAAPSTPGAAEQSGACGPLSPQPEAPAEGLPVPGVTACAGGGMNLALQRIMEQVMQQRPQQ